MTGSVRAVTETGSLQETKNQFPRSFVILWLIALIATAAYIRIAGTEIYHLSADELIHRNMAGGATLADVWRFAMNETNPPLNAILLHCWSRIFGTSATALRDFSLIFGLLLILIYYAIGKQIGGQLAGMCCAALAAFGYGEVIETYIVRPYPDFLFFLSLAFYYQLRWLEKPDTKLLMAYTALSALACFTHFAGVLAMFSMAMGALPVIVRKVKANRSRIEWIIANLIIGCVVIFTLLMWRKTMAFFQSGVSQSYTLSPVILQHALLSPLFTVGYLLPFRSETWFVLVLYGVVAVLFGWACFKVKRLRFALIAMAIGFIVSMVLYARGAYAIRGVMGSFPGRHDLWQMPFVITVIGVALSDLLGRFAHRISAKYCIAIVLICACLLYDPKLRFHDEEYTMPLRSYDEITRYFKDAGPSDLIVVDRATSSLLSPEGFNPYAHMDHGGWTDGGIGKVISYGNAHMLLDIFHLRLDRKSDLIELYRDAQKRDQLAGITRLLFVNIGSEQTSLLFPRLAKCAKLDKTVTTFPQNEKSDQADIVLFIISRNAFDEQIAAENGAANACLTQSQ